MDRKEWLTIIDIMWKKRYKRSLLDLKKLTENWYSYWIKLLDYNDLLNYYENVYKQHIIKKENSNVKDLITYYKDRITNNWLKSEEIYFIYINKQDIIYWGNIVVYKKNKNKFMLWFRAYREIDTIKFNVGIWTVLEYLFFNYALEKPNIDTISRWLDRNMYWYLWSKITLFLHKMHYGFLPYNFWTNKKIIIDESKIDKESFAFTKINEHNMFCEAIYWTNKSIEEITPIKDLLNSKWIDLIIKKY